MSTWDLLKCDGHFLTFNKLNNVGKNQQINDNKGQSSLLVAFCRLAPLKAHFFSRICVKKPRLKNKTLVPCNLFFKAGLGSEIIHKLDSFKAHKSNIQCKTQEYGYHYALISSLFFFYHFFSPYTSTSSTYCAQSHIFFLPVLLFPFLTHPLHLPSLCPV